MFAVEVKTHTQREEEREEGRKQGENKVGEGG